MPHLTRLTSLSLSRADLSLITFENFCAIFSNLQALDLTAVSYLPEAHLIHLTRIKSLYSLKLDIAQSLDIIKDLTQLTSLKIKMAKDFLWDPLAWTRFTNLEVLDFSGSQMERLDFPNDTLTRVTQLVLDKVKFDPLTPIRLRQLPNLEKLSMNGVGYNCRTAGDYMAACTALTYLSVRNFSGYISGLAQLTQLRELDALSASMYGDELPRALMALSEIESLSFSIYWPFKQSEAVDLVQRLTKLCALVLHVTEVDLVLESLSPFLTNLRSLDLTNSRTNRVSSLTGALIKFPHLTRVIMPSYCFNSDWF